MTILEVVDVAVIVEIIMEYQVDYLEEKTQKYYFSQQYSYYYLQVLDVQDKIYMIKDI